MTDAVISNLLPISADVDLCRCSLYRDIQFTLFCICYASSTAAPVQEARREK